MRLLAIYALAVGLGGCAAADLRPDPPVFTDDAETEGRAWLAKAALAQGAQTLEGHQTASLWLKDLWTGWVYKTAAMPWPENGQPLRIDTRLGTDDGRVTFIGGPKAGQAWGIQQGATYIADTEGILTFDAVDDPDSKIQFWIPTTLYFPFIAWRIQEATVVRMISPQVIGGRTYQRVFVSWGTPEPQSDIDQYVIYIDHKTHFIRWANYTVRDIADFATGLMQYSDYRDVGGLKLPFSMRVVPEFNASEDGLHQYVVDRVELDPALPERWLLPRPELRSSK